MKRNSDGDFDMLFRKVIEAEPLSVPSTPALEVGGIYVWRPKKYPNGRGLLHSASLTAWCGGTVSSSGQIETASVFSLKKNDIVVVLEVIESSETQRLKGAKYVALCGGQKITFTVDDPMLNIVARKAIRDSFVDINSVRTK